MCKQMIMLAYIDCRRYVFACEHGVTHIVWNNVSLRIRSRRFVALAQQLSQTLTVAVQHRIAGNRAVAVVLDQHDHFQVWIEGCALYLKPDSTKRFAVMLQRAASHAHFGEVATSVDRDDGLPPVDETIQVAPHLFSVN